MKKVIYFIGAILLCICLVACDLGIYTVNFYDRDGNLYDSYICQRGSEIDIPTGPEREGYKFTGWNPEVSTTVTENQTYYPKYEKLYLVSFYDYDESLILSKYYEKNEVLVFPNDPVRSGYTFAGWDGIIVDKVTADLTFTAMYNSQINIKFVDYDDTVISENLYDKRSNITIPVDPVREGYDFLGWNPEVNELALEDTIYKAVYEKKETLLNVADNISFHFIDLQNTNTGDCIYIKAGDIDIIIDGGSTKGSSAVIEEYVDKYCTDKKIEYAIITHYDSDHIAAFVGSGTNPGLFSYYDCEIIIDAPLTNKTTQIYKDYVSARDNECSTGGGTHYTALECYKNQGDAQRVYSLGNGLEMEILYNYFYEHNSSDENNYSVCVLFRDTINKKYFLFTGDLEQKGEEYLVQNNNLPKVDLFKAGHHGSPTSSNTVLLNKINPEICVICCVAGAPEYTKNIDNIFPSTAFINRISKYTENVYCTTCEIDKEYAPLNGNVVVSCINGVVSVNCSNNNTILKDSIWFNSEVSCYMDGANYMFPTSSKPGTMTRIWREWPE